MAKKKKSARSKRRATPPEPIVEQLAVAVPPERAWEALTTPRVLGDITMGHVEMDWRPGHAFAWHWGVWEKSAPGKHSAAWRGTVLDSVPGSTLVLSGEGVTATLTVKGEGGSALITVVQGSAPPGSTEDFSYGWADFLLKFKTLVEPPAAPGALYLRTLVRGTPNEILRAFLSATTMSKLLPGKAKVQAKTGGAFAWQWKSSGAQATGKIVEIEKGRRVALAWEATVPPSEVRLSAERTPYGTLVSLEHLHLAPDRIAAPAGSRPPARDRRGYRRLWAHLLERLRGYFYFSKKIRAG